MKNWRVEALRRVYLVAAVAAPTACILDLWITGGSWSFVAVLVGSPSLMIGSWLLRDGRWFRPAAYWLPFYLSAAAFASSIDFGVSPGAVLVMVAGVVIGGALLNSRAIGALACAHGLALALVGVAIGAGVLPAPKAHAFFVFSDVRNWLRVAVNFVVLSSLLATFVAFIVNRLEKGIAERVEAVARLRGEIAERRRAEDALGEREHYFRSLIEGVEDTITVVGADGTLTYASPSIERVLGYPPNELIGRLAFEFVHPDDRSLVAGLFEGQTDKGGYVKATEYRFKHKDGSWRPLESVAKNLLNQPAVAGVIVNSRDLTDRRRLEEQVRQSQKMEAIGRLAGGIAHDFNNLLSVILSYSEMLVYELPPGDPTRTSLEEVSKAGRQAANLTRQLLAFSRQQVLEPVVLDLNESLGKMDKMVRRILGEDIELVSELARPLGHVRIDPGSVEQLVLNLVVNARDAMPVGGKLTIETRDVVVDDAHAAAHSGVKAGAHVVLAVGDNGVGMDGATQTRVFEPFFTTKARGKGTGLGLATVFGIVQQSGGNILVDSAFGKGTTFRVYFPRVDAPVAFPRPETLPPSSRGWETILLVEDEDQVRAVARAILRRQGYQVIESRHPGEAFLMCEKHAGDIHLLLTDVVMPQMGGPELAKRLTTIRPTMKVLCMSGYTDDSVLRHGLVEQFAFVQKPITPETLTRKVRDVLDGTAAGA